MCAAATLDVVRSKLHVVVDEVTGTWPTSTPLPNTPPDSQMFRILLLFLSLTAPPRVSVWSLVMKSVAELPLSVVTEVTDAEWSGMSP